MMMHRTLAMAMALCLAAVMSSASAKPSESYYRTHELNSLDYRVAETLAWEICGSQESTDDMPCKVSEASNHKLVVLGPDAAHAAIVKMLSERDPAGKPAQRFEVTLVGTVDRSEAGSREDMPSHVRNALEGLEELMQGVRFTVLAGGWVRTSNQGEIRMEDVDGNGYIIRLHYRGRRTGLDRTELEMGVTATADSNNPNLRALLKTSLSIFVGETVVVGSSISRIADSPAVVLLLTAHN